MLIVSISFLRAAFYASIYPFIFSPLPFFFRDEEWKRGYRRQSRLRVPPPLPLPTLLSVSNASLSTRRGHSSLLSPHHNGSPLPSACSFRPVRSHVFAQSSTVQMRTQTNSRKCVPLAFAPPGPHCFPTGELPPQPYVAMLTSRKHGRDIEQPSRLTFALHHAVR